MTEISVGSVSVDVVPDATRFWSTFTAKAMPGAYEAGTKVGREVSAGIASQVGDVRVGVDVDDVAAKAQVAEFAGKLDELGARSPDVKVDVDAAAAAAELAAVQVEADRLDGRDINLDVNDRGSVGEAEAGLSGLMTTGIALGPAIIPVAAAVAAAIAGIGTAAVAAVAGIGVLFLAFSGISAAVKELTKNQTDAGATAARTAAQQISSAASIANAEQSVRDAVQGVTDARRQAAQSTRTALEEQRNAELSLADAQRSAKQAQADLNAAREQAKRDLEDLTLAVQDGALALQQANLDVESARENLNKVLTNPQTTALQRQQALLTYQQAVQQVTDLTVRQQRLQAQQAAASKAGVDGAKVVQTAQDRLRAAQEQVARARQREADAERRLVQVRTAGAEAVAKAEERVAAAQRSLAVAQANAAAQSAAGFTKTKSALAELTPAGQQFARFIAGTLLPLFDRIRSAAQAGLLPGLQAGIQALLPLMPAFTSFVGGLATVMGQLFAQAAHALTAPFWVQFFGFLSSTIGPDLAIFAGTLENLGKGFAGLFEAFSPVATQIGNGLLHLSAGFARFGANARHSKAFQDFLSFLERTGPVVARTIGALVTAFAHVVAAIAPIGVVVLPVLTALATVIKAIPPVWIQAIATAIIGLVVGLKAWAAIQAILNLELWGLEGIPVVALVVAIGLAVVALIAGIIELVKHWHAVWSAIKSTVLAVYRTAIEPVFHGIVSVAETVVGWLKRNWPLLLDILTGPFGLAVTFVVKHWNGIVGFFEKMPGRIAKATVGMWDGIKDTFRAVIDTIIGWWDTFVSYLKIPGFHIDTHIPGVGKIGFDGIDIGSHLQIPYLADGGMATVATLGVLGEAGREAILPLDDPRAVAAIRDALTPRSASPLIGKLEINNPKPEPASTSLPRAMRRAAFRAGYALG